MSLPAELVELAQRVSNWGRWGDDDQLGCGNLLTPEATRRGVAAVRTGERGAPPATLNTTWELDAVAQSISARRWPRHPLCGC